MAERARGRGSDVGRRIALRREQLGLSREDVAGRAGMAPQYLRYLEERLSSPGGNALSRLARALDTTVAELRGGEAHHAPGAKPARPRVTELGPAECHRLVAAHHIGRVAAATPQGPAIVPVVYAVVGGAIVFRATPGTGASAAGDADETAFEVDHLDEDATAGWSVLLVGRARRITDPGEGERLAERVAERLRERGAAGGPWAPERDAVWVRLRPARVTGWRARLG
ncbi:helix-turn-helix domain-containing protein [Streptomyces radicis]|uniref:Helix-turn-helix domain-containing protein n=1 Tax=Streptomyces radicis TaxID=1750517 RepID=A0A3A9WG17_9ACTN|nr:pyridoxamine 5'-phosphate oxidase family protein [Streptomyces radicis]RKN11978.1 helix-turn-helix domain-containing protein [Streptomyces radicis]RKN25970.1 helix-turn-helix domain-containing protein [Streptomyces radicis]